MDYKIVKREEFKVLGLKLTNNTVDMMFGELWKTLATRDKDILPLAKQPIRSYGVSFNIKMDPITFDYMAALEVEDVDTIPEGAEVLTIPAQEYAVFETNLTTLMETIHSIYNEWLPRSDYKRGHGPEFELYEADFEPEGPNSTLYLYIPVVKK